MVGCSRAQPARAGRQQRGHIDQANSRPHHLLHRDGGRRRSPSSDSAILYGHDNRVAVALAGRPFPLEAPSVAHSGPVEDSQGSAPRQGLQASQQRFLLPSMGATTRSLAMPRHRLPSNGAFASSLLLTLAVSCGWSVDPTSAARRGCQQRASRAPYCGSSPPSRRPAQPSSTRCSTRSALCAIACWAATPPTWSS